METYKNFACVVNSMLKDLCVEFHSESDRELRDMFHYAVMSGRRYRPSLVLTGKLIGDSSFDNILVRHAITVELIHKYSLILDDSVDNDPLRRGEQTFYQKYGRNNAQAMSAYIMNLLFREIGAIQNFYHNDPRRESILRLYDEILSDMSVGFISDLNRVSRDVRGIRRISDMQTSTLLRNAMLIGFLSSDYYAKNECSFLYKTLYELGNHMGTIFQAYNDIEVFCGEEFQLANKGQLFPDFIDNRKNIILSKIPIRIVNNRDTNELINYINSNHLFEEVFNEIFDILNDIKSKLPQLPTDSEGTHFLKSFLKEKESVIINLSKTDIFNFNRTSDISAM